jgi:diadenosine tetraphosphatase ApaH/serine/threonine PP2A family protein phosphatase
MDEIAEYVLSGFDAILSLPLERIQEAGQGVLIPSFDRGGLLQLCDSAEKHFANQPTLLRIYGDICVVGDIHGSLHDLLRILKANSTETEVKFLFLGDYVDRGDFSIEVISLLFGLALSRPGKYFLIRGNHETAKISQSYGFMSEIEKTFGDGELWRSFTEVFTYLPLGAVVNATHFCVHGGLPQSLTALHELGRTLRPIRDPLPVMINDLLWADPSISCPRFIQGTRGDSHDFGHEALRDFLSKNGLHDMIRSHQYSDQSLQRPFPGLITIFSASSYKRNGSNPSVVLRVNEASDEPEVMTYPPYPRLPRQNANFFSYKFVKIGSVVKSNSIGWSSRLNAGFSGASPNANPRGQIQAAGSFRMQRNTPQRVPGVIPSAPSHRNLGVLKLMTFQPVFEDDDDDK